MAENRVLCLQNCSVLTSLGVSFNSLLSCFCRDSLLTVLKGLLKPYKNLKNAVRSNSLEYLIETPSPLKNTLDIFLARVQAGFLVENNRTVSFNQKQATINQQNFLLPLAKV